MDGQPGSDISQVPSLSSLRLAAPGKEAGLPDGVLNDIKVVTPFGGFKQSGFGRDRSSHALDNYTELKTAWQHFSD